MAALEAEAAIARDALERCQAILVEAAARILPAHLMPIMHVPKHAVRPRESPDTAADLSCRAPRAAWLRLRAGADAGAAVRVRTVSEYGLDRTTEYHSAHDLGRAFVAALSQQAREVAADVRVRDDGCLLITTQLHMRRQRALGRLHCAACGAFCNGERGLRDHQHAKHTGSYEGALQAVAAAKGTLVRHSAIGAHLAELWAARAAEAERQKKELPAGLQAARDGDMTSLRALVAGGCWSAHDVVDRHGSTALHYAAGSGQMAVCEYLVDELNVLPTQAQSKDGRTALHWAARNGRGDVCRWLISRGVDPDVGTRDGTRPLHWAVWQGHLDVCELLLDAKADLHARNAYGCNAIQWAAQTDASDGLVMCRWLLGRGLDVGVLNGNGHSALHKAAVKGQRAVCEWLLAPDGGRLGRAHLAADGDGNTPSLMARLEGHLELADYLADYLAGAPPRSETELEDIS